MKLGRSPITQTSGVRWRLTPAVLPVLLVAVSLTVLLVPFERTVRSIDWKGWRYIGPMAVIAGWLAVVAWLRSAWKTAACCLTATLLGPWGYFYPGALLALALAVTALGKARHQGAQELGSRRAAIGILIFFACSATALGYAILR